MNILSNAPLVHDVQAARRVQAEMEASGHLRGAYQLPAGLSVFTAHNYSEPSLLERNLDYLGVRDYTVLNERIPVWSNSLRIRWFVDYLKNECRTDLVLYCDADDVVLRDDPQRIVDLFHAIGGDLLYGSTRWPHGYQCIPEVRQWADRLHPSRYLNGGVFIGRREFVRAVYERVLTYVTDADTHGNPDSHAFYRDELRFRDQFPRGVGCDQAILRCLEPEFHPRLRVDADGRFVWRNDNRTTLQRLVRGVKRSIPAGLKQPLKRWLKGR